MKDSVSSNSRISIPTIYVRSPTIESMEKMFKVDNDERNYPKMPTLAQYAVFTRNPFFFPKKAFTNYFTTLLCINLLIVFFLSFLLILILLTFFSWNIFPLQNKLESSF